MSMHALAAASSPPRRRGPSIRHKLLASYLAITLLALGCATVALWLQFSAAEEIATMEAENVANAIVSIVGDDPLSNTAALQRAVAMFHANHSRDAFVIDIHRRVVADADPGEIGSVLPPVHNNAVRLTLEDGRTRSFVEVLHGSPVELRQLVLALRKNPGSEASPIVGAFVVEYTQVHDMLLARVRTVAYIVLAMGVAFMLLATALGLRFAHAIATPLRKLARGARAIAQGQYDTRFEAKSTDEIGALATAFNQMAGDLGAVHARVLEHRHDLERRVAQRTLEWQQAAAAQRESAAELQLIAENLPVGLCYIDHDMRFRYHNRQYLRLIGMPAQDINGRTIADMLGSATFAAMEGVILQVLAGQRMTYERRHADGDGGVRDLMITLIPRRADDGSVIGYYAMTQDVSERKRAEQALLRHNDELTSVNRQLQQAQDQLLQSEKMASIGQLASGVAHEINNPIGYVQSNFGTLDRYLTDIFEVLACYESAESSISDPALRMKIEAAKRAADLDFVRDDVRSLLAQSKDGIARVSKIVSDLKGYSRSTSDESWQPADVHAGIDSTLNIVWNEIKYKADVQKQYGALPEIQCRPSQLNQVFMNLLVNAAQAIKKQGTIGIRTGVEGKRVWLEFTDTGEGIEPAHLNRIFEPFFTTKPVGKGTGLGLALAYGIVKDHGGEITVRSVAGEGTVFCVWLPINQTLDTLDTHAAA